MQDGFCQERRKVTRKLVRLKSVDQSDGRDRDGKERARDAVQRVCQLLNGKKLKLESDSNQPKLAKLVETYCHLKEQESDIEANRARAMSMSK